MSRVLGCLLLLAAFAGTARAEEERSAYEKANARLTEQLNAVISERVELKPPAPPAQRDDSSDDAQPPHVQARR